MAKGKNKLNKTNSSGWLDNYSEELSISEYQDGGKLKQYFKLPTKRVAVDNTYNKNSPIGNSSDDKEMVNRLLREKANESQKAKEKRIADVRRLEELNQKSMLETANAKDLYDIGEGMKSKYRFSNEDNFFDDYINPLNMVGGMAGGLAQTPELINQGEYGNAALNVGLPLTVGALAGIGTQNAGQFVNNLVNPLAGTGNLFKRTNNLTSSVDDVVDFSKYPSQLEAVQARAERLLSQKNKKGWNEQLTPNLEERLTTAVKRHNPASDYPGEKLGANTGGRTATEVSRHPINADKLDPNSRTYDPNAVPIYLNNANKARVAAHETGHYYANSLEEGTDWQKYFDFSNLPYKKSKYLKGKSNFYNFSNEIRERAAQLKDYIAFKNKIPLNQDFQITKSQLDDALKNYVKDTELDNTMTPFINSITDKKGLLKEMNKRALGIVPPAAIGLGAASQFYNGQGEGEINQYADGGIIDTIKEFFTEKTNKPAPKSAPAKSSPKTFKIEDKRKVLATSGQPIRPNVDITSGEYDLDVLKGIIESAKRKKLPIEDVKNLAAIAFQETKFGKTDENLGHVSENFESRSDLEALTNAYITKMKEADRLGIKDEAKRLQVYNGLKLITPDTEKDYHGFKMKKIYGVPVPKEGINMKKNPLYGKQIMDLRDNVLNQNPEYVNYLNTVYNSKDPVPVYSDVELKSLGPPPLLGKFADGGKVQPYITNNPNDPRLLAYQDSLNIHNKTILDYNKAKKTKLASDGTPLNLNSENRQDYNKWKNEYKRVNIGGISCDHSDYYNSEDLNQEVLLPSYPEDDEEPLYLGFFHTGAYQDAISGYGGIKHCLIPSPKHVIIDRDDKGNIVDYVYRNEQSAVDMFKILGYEK